MKNVTLSANEADIEAARQKARSEDTTLNEEFRKWLRQYGRHDDDYAKKALALIDDLRTRHGTGGRKFTREEMNERR